MLCAYECTYVVYTDRHTRIYGACNRYRRGLPKTKNTEANLAEPEDIRRGASRIFLCICCCCCCFLWSYCFILLPTLFLLKIRFFFIFVFYFYFDFAFHFAFCPHKNKNKNLLCHISLSLSLLFRWCFVIFVVSKLVLFLASLFIYSTYVSHTFSV